MCSCAAMRSRLQELAQRRPGLVAPDHRKQAHLRAERGGVARDVGRAAGALLDAVDLHDRHRRLGRDAADLAEPVAVEHHVADDQHARLASGSARSAAFMVRAL